LNIEIPLYGGLGNQLFGYAFGLHSHVFGRHDVKFIVSPDSPWNASHNQNVCIDFEFEIDLPWRVGGTLGELKAGAMRFAARKSPNLLGRHLNFLDERSWQDNFLDFKNKGKINISGYFRTPAYLTALQEKGLMRNLKPRFTNEETESMLERSKETDSIFMHVRRGDYSRIGSSLHVSYFVGALEQIQSSRERKILVFSDSPDQAKSEFLEYSKSFDFEFVKFDLPSTQMAAVSMAALSQSKTLVMSNSTFSWWSASTGNTSKVVYYPQGWNSQIMSPEWIKVTSPL